MRVLINDSAYEMDDVRAEQVARFVAPFSKGIYAIEKDGTMMLVDEPYSAQRVLELAADGYAVRHNG